MPDPLRVRSTRVCGGSRVGHAGDMTGAVLILLIVIVAALVLVAGLTPFLFIPLAGSRTG
jgi:hypothetical protein